MILGTDGGPYQSFDAGSHWQHLATVAAGEFYRINVDDAEPYRICGGLQDNLNWVGPSRTFTKDGIVNADWINVGGGDGFYCIIDAEKPNLVYAESALELGAKIDQPFFYPLLDWVKEYEEAFGYLSAEKVVWDLSQYLVVVSTPSLMRWFHSTYFINRAFRDDGKAQYSNALYAIKLAVLLSPMHLGNRGVLSVLLRSVFKKYWVKSARRETDLVLIGNDRRS